MVLRVAQHLLRALVFADLGLRIRELENERGHVFNISWRGIERFRKTIIIKCTKIGGGNHSSLIEPENVRVITSLIDMLKYVMFQNINSVIVEPFDFPCVTNLIVTLHFSDNSKNEDYSQTGKFFCNLRE